MKVSQCEHQCNLLHSNILSIAQDHLKMKCLDKCFLSLSVFFGEQFSERTTVSKWYKKCINGRQSAEGASHSQNGTIGSDYSRKQQLAKSHLLKITKLKITTWNTRSGFFSWKHQKHYSSTPHREETLWYAWNTLALHWSSFSEGFNTSTL